MRLLVWNAFKEKGFPALQKIQNKSSYGAKKKLYALYGFLILLLMEAIKKRRKGNPATSSYLLLMAAF